jgi:hypothetical protein
MNHFFQQKFSDHRRDNSDGNTNNQQCREEQEEFPALVVPSTSIPTSKKNKFNTPARSAGNKLSYSEIAQLSALNNVKKVKVAKKKENNKKEKEEEEVSLLLVKEVEKEEEDVVLLIPIVSELFKKQEGKVSLENKKKKEEGRSIIGTRLKEKKKKENKKKKPIKKRKKNKEKKKIKGNKNANPVSIDFLKENSDVISLHTSITKESNGMTISN